MGPTTIGVPPERSRRTVVLALGDAAAIALFVALGELRHGGTFAAGVETFLQFGIGWVVAALLLGAYARRSVSSPGYAVVLALVAWTLAALIGQGVRIATGTSAGLSVAFLLVSIAVGGALLALWRAVAATRPGRY